MTKRQLYLEASRRLAEGEQDYSCNAIGSLTRNYSSQLTRQIQEVKEYCEVFNTGHFYDEFVYKVVSSKNSRNLRVMMTSLMAVCWRDFQ